MKYQAIIFDWDGTLVDSTGRIVEAMHLAANDIGLPSLTDHDVRQIIGLGLPEAIMDLWPQLDAQSADLKAMREAYNEHYMAEARPSINFFDYGLGLLESLNKEGFDLAVATGKSRRGLQRAFRELKVGHLFADSRCADETRSKPHPLMLNELAESLSVEPSAMLMIGDTQFDLNMANAANVDCVAITHGAHDEEKLSACNPLHMVDDLRGLHDWLKQIA